MQHTPIPTPGDLVTQGGMWPLAVVRHLDEMDDILASVLPRRILSSIRPFVFRVPKKRSTTTLSQRSSNGQFCLSAFADARWLRRARARPRVLGSYHRLVSVRHSL